MSDIEFAPFMHSDIAEAHGLSALVKWPHRPDDWRMLTEVGAGVSARLGSRLAGAAMWFCHDETFATIGMVIVAPEMQGRGIGGKLMARALAAVGSRRIRLNSTTDGLPLYQKLGFREIGRIVQHQGEVPENCPANTKPGIHARPIAGTEFGIVAKLDRAASGSSRSALLQALQRDAVVLVAERDSQTVGYAMHRDFGRGRLIGPVVASDETVATQLIDDALSMNAGAFVRIDVDGRCGLPRWLSDRGLLEVDQVIVMERQSEAQNSCADGMHLFALASQALG